MGAGLALMVALLAVGHMAGAARAGTTPPGLYLMTEGPLEMEMTPFSGTAPTTAELRRLNGMAHEASVATARYRNLSAAIADGYLTAPDLVVPTQGAHYFKPEYFDAANSGQFDLTHPPFLVYNRLHGKTVLSGLMYYLPATTPLQRLASIFPANLASWHRHINVCVVGGDSLLDGTKVLPIHDQSSCVAHGGTFTARTGWMVHLWLGKPAGPSLFAMDRE
jgi:hypothetical protein